MGSNKNRKRQHETAISHPLPNKSSEGGKDKFPRKEDEGEEGKQNEEGDVPCAVCGELGDDDRALMCGECDRP